MEIFVKGQLLFNIGTVLQLSFFWNMKNITETNNAWINVVLTIFSTHMDLVSVGLWQQPWLIAEILYGPWSQPIRGSNCLWNTSNIFLVTPSLFLIELAASQLVGRTCTVRKIEFTLCTINFVTTDTGGLCCIFFHFWYRKGLIKSKSFKKFNKDVIHNRFVCALQLALYCNAFTNSSPSTWESTWWAAGGPNHHHYPQEPGSPQDGLPGDSNHNHGHELVQPSDAQPLGDYDYEEDELTYLVENADFEEMDIETIGGNKKDSTWLIINNQYIGVKNNESVSGNILLQILSVLWFFSL